VRCTWYNIIWFLTFTDGEVYLIQHYLIFDFHRWWGVLDTTLSYLLVLLPPSYIKYTSPSVRVKNQIKFYQVHLTIGESQKSDKVVSSTPHHRWKSFIWFLTFTDGEVYLIELYLIFDSHRWWGVLDTTLSDTIDESQKSDKVVSSTPHHWWEPKIR
jgi:hypothetical protein